MGRPREHYPESTSPNDIKKRVTVNGRSGSRVDMSIPPLKTNPKPEDIESLRAEVKKANKAPDVVRPYRGSKR